MMLPPRDQDANLIYRRFSGSEAGEIFVHCRPDPRRKEDIAQQTTSIYQALDFLLRRENGSLEQVVYETVFFRDIKRDFEQFQKTRLRIFDSAAGIHRRLPASSFIEQPPLDAEVDLVISAVAVIPHRGSLDGRGFSAPASGRSFVLGEQKYLYAGSICGAPGNAFDQTYDMFCLADEVLKQEGMDFRHVVRTWIYLREMERDYAEFNRARREFFRRQNVTLLPASTGIYGSPFPEKADLMLSFCALRSPRPLEAFPMTTPTLNEATTYGSDFSRGLRVVEGNKVALYISGTASVDEEGRTAHIGDFGGQVERMLLNVETLLSAQSASFENVLSAVTYLKFADDAPILRRILGERGLAEMPNALVHAAVCRPDLLCEIEAVAALPLPAGR
ncbi:MAG: Rid family hydrolase [Acidobacteriota bacterium]|jgi:enamine deaminase RidA (YjgF/YER057c/UK114 family)